MPTPSPNSADDAAALPQGWAPDLVARHESRWMHLAGRFTSTRTLRRPDLLARAVRGKVVVITGASSGVGAALAAQCADAGAQVVICARSADLLEEVAVGIRARGGLVDTHRVDLGDDEQVRAFAAAVLRDHGRVDVLVHNAGKSLNRSVERSARRPKDLNATLAANYVGPVRLTMALLPYMRARGEGHIVNVSTLGMLMPATPRWSLYLASKAAFDWWLRCVASEIEVDGVRVTTHYLGSARTKMSASDNLLTRLPSQSADDAARGVAHSIVHRPRIGAWRPLFVVGALSTLLRGPMDRLTARAYRRIPEPRLNASRALPQEELVYGDPDALATQHG
ncbi:MAG TPA: SDR family NAD(P)-dependent oxidoreductase [Acidimicrobiales bacterium]|nr:SDR family NAD(P)-dependent oxidoreductase [Acidimicrobiales bacterium]